MRWERHRDGDGEDVCGELEPSSSSSESSSSSKSSSSCCARALRALALALASASSDEVVEARRPMVVGEPGEEGGEVEKRAGFALLPLEGVVGPPCWCEEKEEEEEGCTCCCGCGGGREEEITGVRARSVRWRARWGCCEGRVVILYFFFKREFSFCPCLLFCFTCSWVGTGKYKWDWVDESGWSVRVGVVVVVVVVMRMVVLPDKAELTDDPDRQARQREARVDIV